MTIVMPIIVRNISIGIDQDETQLLDAVAKRLRVERKAIRTYSVVRRSLDARRQDDIHFSYQVELELDESPSQQKQRLARLRTPNALWLEPPAEAVVEFGRAPLPQRPIIVGFGPGGMFAALRLAQYGYKPLVLERGREVKQRHRDIMQRFYREGDFDPTSNLLFGEGGAGTYSDGKLYTRVNDPLCRYVLVSLYQHGADPDILIDTRPHIGSDRLPTICSRIREKIKSLGGEIRFESQVDDIQVKDGRLDAVHLADPEQKTDGEWLHVGPLILAIGHSARDTIRMLHRRGVQLDPKPFQIGVRIEHPQACVDRWQYGSAANHQRLAPAEYHLVAKNAAGDQGDVFSFCMCPGGVILPTNEAPGLIATNGASRSQRSGQFANCGLVMTVNPQVLGLDSSENLALASMDYLERWERLAFETTGGTYRVPAQRATDYMTDTPSDGTLETSYPLGGQWAQIKGLVPDSVAMAITRAIPILDKKLPGFAGGDTLITAPETRASSPVRINRDKISRQAVDMENLYPVGEGAGYAGGIVSAAVDGIKSADSIISHYAPPK